MKTLALTTIILISVSCGRDDSQKAEKLIDAKLAEELEDDTEITPEPEPVLESNEPAEPDVQVAEAPAPMARVAVFSLPEPEVQEEEEEVVEVEPEPEPIPQEQIDYSYDNLTGTYTLPKARLLSEIPDSLDTDISLDIHGVDVKWYRYKIGLKSETDCSNHAGYTGDIDINEPIIEDLTGLEGEIVICLLGATLDPVWQLTPQATKIEWTKTAQ